MHWNWNSCGHVNVWASWHAWLGCLFRTYGCNDDKIFYQALFANKTIVVYELMYMHLAMNRLATSSSFDSFLLSVITWNRHIFSWTYFNRYSRHFPGIESVYWWEGKVQTDAEELLIIKTRESLLSALTEHVKANHEYDVPEVIALPISGGNLKYLEWLKNSTRENWSGFSLASLHAFVSSRWCGMTVVIRDIKFVQKDFGL